MIEQNRQKKRVVVINTGGTIFMHDTPRGRVPGPAVIPRDRKGNVSDRVHIIPINLFGSGIDSSEMTLKHSKKLAETIVKLQNDSRVDGIVVTHGTDTMAETAMELDYALKNLKKPIVLTGSQVPMGEHGSDGPHNLFRSIHLAANAPDLRRVVICFGQRTGEASANYIIGARNAEKVHSSNKNAFEHPDAKILGRVSITNGVQLNPERPIHEPTGHTTLDFKFNERTRRSMLQRHTKSLPLLALGLVVDLYGAGNAPKRTVNQMRLRSKFYPVVAASQARGKINMTAYAPGTAALEAGVIPAGGLTALSASKRLSYLVGHNREIKQTAIKNRVKPRALFTTLFLSGAEFDSPEIAKKHSDLLGLPILKDDLLVGHSFDVALKRAVGLLKTYYNARK